MEGELRYGMEGVPKKSPVDYTLQMLCCLECKKILKNYSGKKKKRKNDISCNHVKQNKQSYLGHESICEKGLV